MKIFNIGNIKTILEKNGTVKGLVTKRDINIRECRYIFKHIFYINILDKCDLGDNEEYKEYNEEIVGALNRWIHGETDDNYIMEFACDCEDEALGLFNLLPLLVYLNKIGVI